MRFRKPHFGFGVGAASVLLLAGPVHAQRAELGFSIRCSNCVMDRREGSLQAYRFSSPPEVLAVDTEGPAARAGLRAGDVITHIDGVSLSTEEGGRRFGEVRPGIGVLLRVRREVPCIQREDCRVTAVMDLEIRPAEQAPEKRGKLPLFYEKVRQFDGPLLGDTTVERLGHQLFAGTFADVNITVEGARPVTVTIVQPDCMLEIEVDGTRIRLRAGACR